MLKTITCAGLSSVLIAGGALAATAPVAGETQTASEPRVLYVCDKTQETKNAFERKFGKIRFVTAEQAMRAIDKKEVWSAPRCMTDTDMDKLAQLQAKRAEIQKASLD